jgi:antitoxin MazE
MHTTRIVKIGNSRGIRIPKPFLDQLGLENEVEMSVQDAELVIRPVRTPRSGWESRFQEMAAAGEDRLMDEEFLSANEWDETEWEW